MVFLRILHIQNYLYCSSCYLRLHQAAYLLSQPHTQCQLRHPIRLQGHRDAIHASLEVSRDTNPSDTHLSMFPTSQDRSHQLLMASPIKVKNPRHTTPNPSLSLPASPQQNQIDSLRKRQHSMLTPWGVLPLRSSVPNL